MAFPGGIGRFGRAIPPPGLRFPSQGAAIAFGMHSLARGGILRRCFHRVGQSHQFLIVGRRGCKGIRQMDDLPAPWRRQFFGVFTAKIVCSRIPMGREWANDCAALPIVKSHRRHRRIRAARFGTTARISHFLSILPTSARCSQARLLTPIPSRERARIESLTWAFAAICTGHPRPECRRGIS